MQTNSFNDFLQNNLNKQQLEAVKSKEGAVLVIAGAGSGKTRVITARIANLLINNSARPEEILALTFTNKAANEMKERIYNFIGSNVIALPFVGTFHSFCLMLLRSNPKLSAYPDFSILDGDDQVTLVKKIIKKHNLEKRLNATSVLSQISHTKNKLIFSSDELNLLNQLERDIYLEYEKEKNISHSLDFDDLLLQTIKIFESNTEFRERFQKKVRHILVDEYQDTNLVQHYLLKLLSLDKKNNIALDSICAVGDEDQSIYSWRGAEPENILNFEEDFGPIKKIKIEQNYRSVQPILEAANSVISNNKKRNPKELWSERKAKNRIVSVISRSEYQEAEAAVEFIKISKSKFPKNSIAILYRTHFQSRVLEEMLARASIPYKIIGGIQFYARKEIKDLLAYMRVIANPYDKVSLFRIINCPTRGVGAKFEEIIQNSWNERSDLNFIELLELMIQDKDLLDHKKAEVIKEFLCIFEGLNKKQKTSEIIDHILSETEYISFLKSSLDSAEAETKIDNVKEFVRSIHYFEQQQLKSNNDVAQKISLETFLHEIALIQDKMENTENQNDFITLMTLHAAKGLEFDTVLITGLEEGLFPSSRSFSSSEDIEEERRLFYVGITRAREYLLLSHSLYRNSFGTITDQGISRFLEEVPEHLLEKLDVSAVRIAAAKDFFDSWLSSKKTNHFTEIKKPSNFTTKFDYKSRPIQNIKPNIHSEKTESKLINSHWQKNQIVFHKKFGRGIITHIEKKSDDEFFISAIFGCGTKKVSSKFLEK